MKRGADSLSRRERQILDVLYRAGRSTAAAVREALPSPPSDSAVRALLKILEDKGHVRHFVDGPRYVYEPVRKLATERRVALSHVVKTFFEGSTSAAVNALLDASAGALDNDQLDDLARRIAAARKEGR